MGLFDTVRDNLAKVAAVAGIPANIVAANVSQGMDTVTPLGPGAPIAPADGFSTVPRNFNYQSGYNIAGRPRSNERISFGTLRAMIDSYDLAQICITHRIDSVRSRDWSLVPAEGIEDDMTDAIKLAKAVLKKPDHTLPFKAWLGKYLWDVLAFDAGALYRMRNVLGGVVGLEVLDGTLIAPQLDAWGRRPGYDFATQTWAVAFVSYTQGLTWDWLTARDIVYTPFRARSNSPYGLAPIESILLNANTDLRFQMFLLQTFTAGNVPEGFAVSPETWTPDQIEQWQAVWDALLAGDQEILSQIKWVPGGTTFEWPAGRSFDNDLAMYYAKKTMAAFHVTPNDLGFTEDVNKSSGESQVSVGERVGDLPLMQHVEDILTEFLQEDLGLPLVVQFDRDDEDDEARLAVAQADKVYIEAGVVSASEVREERFGRTELNGDLVPRYIMTAQGPVALSTLYDASAPVSDESAAPLPGTTVPGSVDPAAIAQGSVADVQKAIEPPRALRPELGPEQRAEITAFNRFVKGAQKRGEWRPFEFKRLDAVMAHRLNVSAFAGIRKAEGELVAAGLCVLAADTGRVLMLQRALDPDDPASGRWEFPGGHIEPGELALDAAMREWSEEVAVPAPTMIETQAPAFWNSPNGVYAGFVIVVPDEACCTPHERAGGLINPDDPDGDAVEAVAWWDPQQLVGNPAVRVELQADMSLVLGAIAAAASAPVVDEVAEDVEPDFQKAAWRQTSANAPQNRYDLPLVDHYAPTVQAALLDLYDRIGVADLIDRYAGSIEKAADPDKQALIDRILAGVHISPKDAAELRDALEQVDLQSFATGNHAAGEQLGSAAVTVAGFDVDWGNWSPGNPIAVSEVAAGALRSTLDGLGIIVQGITDTVLDTIGNHIAEGLLNGWGSDKIERTIRDLVGSSGRAERIAHTEVARAQTNASLLVFRMSGVTEYDLLLSDGACPECVAIADANPYVLDDDTGRVPIHPFCRCADSPRASSIDPSLIETVPTESEDDE